MKKLTLSADEDVIRAAHRIAEEQGTSISALFSRFIRLLARHDRSRCTGAMTRRATGLIEIPDDVSGEDVLTEALIEKHRLGLGLDSGTSS